MASYTGNLNFKVNQGDFTTKTIVLKQEPGAVIRGRVTFADSNPVYRAVVVLNSIYRDTITPLTFTFTDVNGEFLFGIDNTDWDYLIKVTYNEEFH